MLAVVALVTVWAAGLRTSAPGSDGSDGTDAARLGPTAGETVAGYRQRARPAVPPGAPRLGLIQFGTGLDADAAGATVVAPGVEVLQGVYRVPLPRVQTAVRRLPATVLGDGSPAAVAAALRAGQTQAANQARMQAGTVGGRTGRVAAVEADALAGRCACVLAVVARAVPAAWPTLAARPWVRATELAPPAARPEALAVSPLLPEQHDVVGPVPDDGPVPG